MSFSFKNDACSKRSVLFWHRYSCVCPAVITALVVFVVFVVFLALQQIALLHWVTVTVFGLLLSFLIPKGFHRMGVVDTLPDTVQLQQMQR